MAAASLLQSCSGYEIVPIDDPFEFEFSNQFHYSDFCGSFYMNWQTDLSIQESYLDVCPLMESYNIIPGFPDDPLYASLDIEVFNSLLWLISDDTSEVCGWNELGSLFQPQNRQMLLLCDSTTTDSARELKNRKCKEKENKSITKDLTRQVISKYFYTPITQAAKELNVGLTLLKKRCRELGIRRWPHRKLMSVQTLIKNVQEMKKVQGDDNEERVREAIEILEREKKLLEEMPDMELEHTTKRLRQACFKANYKKRKLMSVMDSASSSSSSSGSNGCFDEDDEEIKFLLNEPFSHANKLMF
ncbi:protein RKD1 [Mercurialis annua]|uniref:protein RKD1 n=1 Tax=Mercurialis annua TaxID=3986 RepID=UPI00215E63CB|nr:protein RKD1 [Mercurialis annua]